MDDRLLTWADREQWMKLLAALPRQQQDIYFSPAYCHAAGSTGEVCAWYYTDGHDCALYPFCLRPLDPLQLLPAANGYYDVEGFYGYGGVAASSYDPRFIAGFHQAFERFCRDRRIAVELTRFHPLLENEKFSAEQLEIRYIQDTVFIDLSVGYDSVWQHSYDAKNRNMIRKAQKNGVTCRIGSDWLGFRRLYWQTMDHCGADAGYYFDDDYFARLRDLKSEEGRCLLLEAVWQDQVVAAQLLMLHGDYAHYHLSARNPDYPQLAATNALLDYAARTAIDAGARQLHLGGGKMVNDSLMRFKAGFSPLRGRFNIGFKAHEPELYRQLCAAWETAHPDRQEKYRNYYLKYRY